MKMKRRNVLVKVTQKGQHKKKDQIAGKQFYPLIETVKLQALLTYILTKPEIWEIAVTFDARTILERGKNEAS